MDGIEDDLRMLSVRAWRQKALDRKEWISKCLGSGRGPDCAVQPLVVVILVLINSAF
jgi:hypothetical protein